MAELGSRIAAEVPNGWDVLSAVGRLLLASAIGALIGWDRERHKKPAGMRTHMLVAIGACVFVLPFTIEGSTVDARARVIQGLATGIGFIGAGSILKLPSKQRIQGLTTAGSIWITAALGALAAIGRVWIVVVATMIAWIVLSQVRRLELHAEH